MLNFSVVCRQVSEVQENREVHVSYRFLSSKIYKKNTSNLTTTTKQNNRKITSTVGAGRLGVVFGQKFSNYFELLKLIQSGKKVKTTHKKCTLALTRTPMTVIKAEMLIRRKAKIFPLLERSAGLKISVDVFPPEVKSRSESGRKALLKNCDDQKESCSLFVQNFLENVQANHSLREAKSRSESERKALSKNCDEQKKNCSLFVLIILENLQANHSMRELISRSESERKAVLKNCDELKESFSLSVLIFLINVAGQSHTERVETTKENGQKSLPNFKDSSIPKSLVRLCLESPTRKRRHDRGFEGLKFLKSWL